MKYPIGTIVYRPAWIVPEPFIVTGYDGRIYTILMRLSNHEGSYIKFHSPQYLYYEYSDLEKYSVVGDED